MVVAYNFRYYRPLYTQESPLYAAEWRGIFAHPAEVSYQIEAKMAAALNVKPAETITNTPALADEDPEDLDYGSDEDEIDVSVLRGNCGLSAIALTLTLISIHCAK